MSGLPIHFPPDAGPTMVMALLRGLDSLGGGPVDREAALNAMAPYLDNVKPRWEVLTLCQPVGLISKASPHTYQLDLRGKTLIGMERWADIVHGLWYFGWDARTPAEQTILWTYRALVDALWECAPVKNDAALKKYLAEDVLARAVTEFEGNSPHFQESTVSVGPKTIRGVLVWLEALTPPTAQNGEIRRRATCPPQLLALALAGIARQRGALAGIDLRLSREDRDLLCRSCFLEPDYLDRMLEWTISTLPSIVRWGATSALGRQVILTETNLGPEHFQ